MADNREDILSKINPTKDEKIAVFLKNLNDKEYVKLWKMLMQGEVYLTKKNPAEQQKKSTELVYSEKEELLGRIKKYEAACQIYAQNQQALTNTNDELNADLGALMDLTEQVVVAVGPLVEAFNSAQHIDENTELVMPRGHKIAADAFLKLVVGVEDKRERKKFLHTLTTLMDFVKTKVKGNKDFLAEVNAIEFDPVLKILAKYDIIIGEAPTTKQLMAGDTTPQLPPNQN